jgi:hypothetical protein
VRVTVVDEKSWVPPLDAAALERLRAALDIEAAGALGTDEVDIAMLNDATPLMRHRAIRDARSLIVRDRDEQVRLETRAILDYLDTPPRCGASWVGGCGDASRRAALVDAE